MWKFWYTAIKGLNFASFKFKSENIVKSNKSNLIEEKRLPEEVQKLPCLYDKGSEGFKKKKKKLVAWGEEYLQLQRSYIN